jgi:hypothetical protein
MHVKDDVPVAAVASGLQPDRISRSGEQYLPPAASSSPQPSRVTRSTPTASQDTSPLSFPDSGRVYRYGEKNLYRKRRYICHRRNTNASSTVETCHLQHNSNTLNHSSLHRRPHITNLFSPCPERVRNDPEDLQVMVTKANSIKGFWYVECDIISPKHLRESALIQLPVVRGNAPSTDHCHKDNVRDLFNDIFNSHATLADFGISEQRKELTMQAIAQVWTTGICNVLENGPYTICSLRISHKHQR